MTTTAEGFLASIDFTKPTVIIVPTEKELTILSSFLKAMGQEYFPIPGYTQTGISRFESTNPLIFSRISSFFQLYVEGYYPKKSYYPCILTTVGGWCRKSPGPEFFQKNSFEIQIQDNISREVLMDKLKEFHFQETEKVTQEGFFSNRGSLVDVWPPGAPYPIRLDRDDDIIDSIRYFRSYDQRSFEDLESFYLIPCREFSWTDAQADILNKSLLQQQIHGGSRRDLMENIKLQIPFTGIDDIFPLFQSSPLQSLKEGLSLISHNQRFSYYRYPFDKKLFNHAYKEIEEIYTKGNGYQFPTTPFSELYHPYEEEIFVDLEDTKSLDLPKFETFHQRWNFLKEQSKESPVIVNFENQSSALEILALVYQNKNKSQKQVIEKEIPQAPLTGEIEKNLLGCLASFENPFQFHQKTTHEKMWMVPETWLRHQTRELDVVETSQEEVLQNYFSQFSEFAPDDWVVHIQHGVGKFIGLVSFQESHLQGDFLVIEYDKGDKVYVPIQKVNQVHKYVGAKATEVKADSLKSANWAKKTQKAKENAQKLAKEIIEHQAKRALTSGHPFSPVGEEYFSFLSAFPYSDTPDQKRASQEIMYDMGEAKPMDRLLCGDVGFGKTEVATRAAYRCILDGKQVAWLVPTTVLAAQHYRTIKERFASFPVTVELWDRSLTLKGSLDLLERVKNKKVDVLIGTHKLFSESLKFADLGLLVVDEEQRFGVLQKDKISELAYGIDILSLSATPIPRTLHMGLLGLKELSLLTTPPKHRLSVKTYTLPFEEEWILQAIQNEVRRGGQVFYVHNVIEEMDAVSKFLQKILPDIRIGIGHGKLHQKDLGDKINEFLEGKYDVFICSTIIESGIDMPNVNTIIVQNANHFGLAQLYQLRGRVGRRSIQGYAYFLFSPGLSEKDEGYERLEILKRHQSLGSGFLVATHDLEMRGSGDLLGKDQSGHILSVGLETYMNLLSESMRSIGGKATAQVREVEVRLPVTFHIPEEYIHDTKERLKVYKKLMSVTQENQLISLKNECLDRFGKFSREVEIFFEILFLRQKLMGIGAKSFMTGEKFTEVAFYPDVLQGTESDHIVKSILTACNTKSLNIKLMPDGKLILPVSKNDFVPLSQKGFNQIKQLLDTIF